MPKLQQLQPLQIYRLLPRTNCKQCGCPGCYAFAFALMGRDKKPVDCTELLKDEYKDSFVQLNEIFGKELTIEEPGLAIDKEKCSGCGDCVVVCNKASTTIVRSGTVNRREEVSPVLDIVDGVIKVVNPESCKRMLNPPELCKLCQEKCPFGAIEFVR